MTFNADKGHAILEFILTEKSHVRCGVTDELDEWSSHEVSQRALGQDEIDEGKNGVE